ncbi:MAG: hypothetical protein AAGN66_03750 [Acidobacteriota bacterium]
MAKPLEYNATLVERVDLTSALTIFKIRPDEPLAGEPAFVPGQYVTLGMNNEAHPDLGSVRRPMSIASAPEERGHLEFYIRWVKHPESDNPLTHLLWRAGAGDRLFLRPKAVGKFTLPGTVGDGDPRLAVMVAAGTGLAPFLSIVRSELQRDPSADLSRYGILHGASYPVDLGYRGELEAMRDRNGLRYLCTVSRPGEAKDWTGDVGRVEDYFKAERIAALEGELDLPPGGLEPTRSTILICGLQGTIGETIKRTLDRGFVPENRKLRRALEVPEGTEASLFFEQYDMVPVIPIDDAELMDQLRRRLRAGLAAT